MPFKTIIIDTPKELGNLVREKRMNMGTSLRKTAASNHIGVRFLSEFERGKTTSEIGKIITALHAVELDLAVVPRSFVNRAESSEKPCTESNHFLSKQLNLEYPYDWSNPNMDKSTFIRLVLERTRFNDILRVTHHFGIERIESEVEKLADIPQLTLIKKLLDRIRIGMQRARNQA